MTASRQSDGRSATDGAHAPRRLRLRITFGFVAGAAVPGIAGGARGMMTWGAVAFASVLAHELGHAILGLLWKSRASIVLHPLGGTTCLDPPLSIPRSILASLMGPLVSLLLGVGISFIHVSGVSPAWLGLAMWLNLAWGAVNLLPFLPFDGGRVLLYAMGGQRALRTLFVSAIIAAIGGAVGLFVFRSAGVTLLAVIASSASLFEWIKRSRAEAEAHLDLPAHLDTASRLLAEGRCAEARNIARAVAGKAQTNETERRALELLAWSLLALDQPESARDALGRARPARAIDAYCRAAVEDAIGRGDHAITTLERARRAAKLSANAVKLLIDLHVRRDTLDQACRVGLDELHLLGADDARRVVEVAFAGLAFPVATELAARLFATTQSPEDGITWAYGLTRLRREQEARGVLARVATLGDGWSPSIATQGRLRELGLRADMSPGDAVPSSR